MKDIAVARYESFGTAGHAGGLKSLNLDGMTERYLSGELDPEIK